VVTSGAQDPYAAVIGLPLQEDVWGSTQCRKTAVFMQDLLAYPLDYIGMGFLVRLVGKPIRKLLNNPASAAVMCGLGVNYELEVPGVDKLRDKIQADCREELKKENIDPTSPEGQQKFKLCTVKLEGPLTVAEGPISDVVNSAVEGIFGLTPPTTFSVAKEWKQGSPSWGILAIMTLEEDSLRKTEAASLAGFGKKSIGALPAVANRAVAQAEFYYDCNSKWEEEDCDGPTEPMWNFRWRARLTPVYPDSPTLQDMFKNLKPALDREFDAAGQTNLGKALKERKTFVVH
jgi:hypothetical protein